jgi:hypothetical protein
LLSDEDDAGVDDFASPEVVDVDDSPEDFDSAAGGLFDERLSVL